MSNKNNNLIVVNPISTVYQISPCTNEPWVLSQNGQPMAESVLIEFEDYADKTMNKYAKLSEPYQQAVIIIEIHDELKQGWSFYGNGIEYIQATDNCNYNLTSKVSSDQKALVLTIKNVGKTESFSPNPNDNLNSVIKVEPLNEDKGLAVNFRYVAKNHADNAIYMSQDPAIAIRRPPVEI